MRVHARYAPAALCAVALSLLLAVPASAQMKMPIEDLDRGLRAAESGGEIPLSNRPMPKMQTVNERLLDRPVESLEAAYVEPAEFGVVIEFEGGRVALEANGVRVVSQ